jgi:tetratricopeptide (TPR) repeat protein
VLDTLFNIYESANDPEKAYPVLNILVEIDPKSPVYLYKKGRIEFLRKEYKKSALTFAEVTKVAPKLEKHGLSYSAICELNSHLLRP